MISRDTAARDPAWAWVPKWFAGVLTFVAVLCAVAAVSSALQRGFQPFRWGVDQLLLPAPPNLAYAAFIAVVAAAVARRKRVAYWLLLGFFGLQLATDATLLLLSAVGVLKPSEIVDEAVELRQVGAGLVWIPAANLVVTVGVLAVLVLARHQFYARVQRASLVKAVLTLGVGLAAGIALGYGLVSAFPGSLRPGDRLPYTVEKVLGDTIVIAYQGTGHPAGWVHLVLGSLGAAALLAAVLALFRSQRAAAVLDPGDEARIRALLAASGERDSLGYFATRRDKAAVFSATGKAAVTYRVVNGVCLASGDPIGEMEAWGPAIAAWLARARAYAWTPAVMGASEDGARAFARAGLKVLELGDEAIIEVERFGLEGREMRPVRQAVRRVERAGYTARIRRHAEVPPDEMADAVRLADAWRDTAAERGFSMALSRLGDPADGRCVLVEALDRDGRVGALLSFTPWGRHGLSLDLMRRDRNGDNGIVEFMVAALVEAAPKLDVHRVSLNFAVFRSAFEEGARIGAGPVLRAWRRLLLVLSHWWQLESLYRSNTKYRPRWVPRFICFGERRELAKVGLACAMAEGFLNLPWRRGPVTEHPDPAALVAAAAVAAPADLEAAGEPAPPEQVRVRHEKLVRLRAAGRDPHPAGFDRTATCGAVTARFDGLPADTHTGERVAVAGRVVLSRHHGRLCFATLSDWSGDVQVMITEPADVAGWKALVDRGDHVGVVGEVVTSRRGAVSVLADRWELTAKCLRPLPDKHDGLADPQTLTRQPYLDLIANPAAREILRTRCTVAHGLREALLRRGFLEVDPPVPPRDAYLTELCVGGVDRVFAVGRGIDAGAGPGRHDAGSTLAAYQTYADDAAMRDLARALVEEACASAHGHGFDGAWPAVPLYEAISRAVGATVTADVPADRLRRLAADAGIPDADAADGAGPIALALHRRLVMPVTTAPTFYSGFPADAAVAARPKPDGTGLTQRWDLVASGTTLATGWSVPVDPAGPCEGPRLDGPDRDDALALALEYGMPPTGALVLHIDRLMALLTA